MALLCEMASGLPDSSCMAYWLGLSRRSFVWFATGAAASWGRSSRASSAAASSETVMQFATTECNVLMTLEFYDRASTNGLRFFESVRQRGFCLSAEGKANRDCLPKFSGSLAIARYHVRPHGSGTDLLSLREYVRTIDGDNSVPIRAPFERTIGLEGGIGSDIQAFGLEKVSMASGVDPWCILRQDLYLKNEQKPFLTVHWKHALSAIRLLDVIPGEQTRIIPAEGRKREHK